MIDVLLTHSYFMYFDSKQEKAMMPYPPLGTLYAASFLEQDGFSVRLFDTMLARNENDIRLQNTAHRSSFFMMTTSTISTKCASAECVKRHSR
jgi:hypothetical protein